MRTHLRMLFCPDLGLLQDTLHHQWVISFATNILESNLELTVLLNQNNDELTQGLLSVGASVLTPTDEMENASETGCVPPRYHARSVLREALDDQEIQYDVVLTQGISLSRYVAGGKSIQPAHWALVEDDPLSPVNPKNLKLDSIQTVAVGSRLLLFASSESRAYVESRVPAATSKTRLIQPILLKRRPSGQSADQVFVLDFNRYGPKWATHSFDSLIRKATLAKRPPQLVVIDSDLGRDDWTNPLEDYPGVRLINSTTYSADDRATVHVVPLGATVDEVRLHSSILRPDDALLQLASHEVSAENLSAPTEQPSVENPLPFKVAFESDLPDYSRTPVVRHHPVRVLLAGADFKFAGDLVDSLIQRADISLSVDLFEANAKPQPKKSKPLLQAAEVIIAEFASKNAIWYSQHVRPDQRLIVHLHGYELLQDWITELNVDNCAAIVFASEFYRQKAIEMRGWPEEKLVVVPNSVNFGDLDRRKSADSRFNIGLIGIVPILKRPDRALDLFERLVAEDKRFTLHIRGHAPWNYGWEWKKSAHQDSYREFYRRIGSNPALRERIVFEPFSPDIANWLQDIGWLLSPSTRETFHLSAIEGAASGAVPIAWRREGSDEIIGEQFNFDSTEAAANFIANCRDDADFTDLSEAAQRHAHRYSTTEVRAKWLDLIFSLAGSEGSPQVFNTEADRVLGTVTDAWHDGDPETAISVLDEHIPLTRDLRAPLKDAEMFFRGIAAADEKRFTQFLPAQIPANNKGPIAIIRPSGATFDEAELSSSIETFVGVTPPAYLRDSGYTPVVDSIVALDAPNDLDIRVDGYTRVDRWFEMVKAQLTPVALTHAELAVQGPWWIALPALQAADQVGIPSTWFIDDEQTLEWIAAASRGELRTHFAAQIAWNCFQATDARVALANVTLPGHFEVGQLDGFVGENSFNIPLWDPAHPHAANYGNGPLQRTNAPSIIQRPLRDTRIALVADRSLSKEWSRHAQVVDLSPSSFAEQLDASFDIAVIHPGANRSGAWKKQIEQDNESVQCDATKLFDRARLLGATTCFIWESSEPLPRQMWSVARKADAIAVTHPETLHRFLQINPSAVRAIARWDTRLPMENRLRLAFRGIYQPVELDKNRLHLETQAAPITNETKTASDDYTGMSLPDLERIAVFTDQPEAIWNNQTLPRSLFDIFPMSELPNRDHQMADYFVVFDGTEIPDANYLLSLWLDAENDTVVVPEGTEPPQFGSEDGELAAKCLYPMTGETSQFRVRRAAAL
ncbi:glycosyltransferase family 4 protein [Corynebacterium coyleae]|uniref:glycosyltransferase family 4 protein n=1 Tax=Corynebacterium coyleae TaxID=53374 RepID=UPI002549CB9A|nr:glycosyltransferase family 4 protein [Corynebacterium coyleae]MDK8800623.1 glycosyltransferase family 4 protein [Corynebacterium coyleae]